jgi:hypothetical protein
MEIWLRQLVRDGSKIGHSLTVLTLLCIRKQRNAWISQDNAIAEHALFMEIIDTCQLWSLVGGAFLKPLFVDQTNVL